MNIDQLVYFTKTLELSNMTQAAKELNVSQPTISMYISLLEKKYNRKLVTKAQGRNASIRPTQYGQSFYTIAKEIIQTIEETQQAILRLTSQYSNKILVGTTPYRGANIIAGCISEFWKRYPYTQLDVVEGTALTNYNLIVNNNIDFFTTITTNTEDVRFGLIPIAVTEAVLAVPLYHPLATTAGRNMDKLPSVNISDFAETPFILGGGRTNIRKISDLIFKDVNYSPLILYETNNTKLMHSLLEAGTGVGFVMMSDAENNNKLAYFRIKNSPPVYVCAVYSRNHKLSEAERYLIYLQMNYYLSLPGYSPFRNESTEKIFSEFAH